MKQEYIDKTVELRHQIHSEPELSGEEKNTKQKLMTFIKTNTNLEVVDRGDWFFACYKAERPKKNPIAFRAEMDALPMDEWIDLPYASKTAHTAHKCGHDGHSSALALLALLLNEQGAERDVYLVFQHAEEIGAGGEPCSVLINEKKISEIYACHNWSGLEKDTVYVKKGICQCASRGITLKFEGLPSHASEPEEGKNPSHLISQLALWLMETGNTTPEALTHPSEDGLLLATIVEILIGSKNFGMSAYRGEISATLRADKEERLFAYREDILKKAQEMADEAQIQFSYSECDIFPETSSDASCAEKVKTACTELKIPVKELPAPFRGSEDFGYFLKHCEGAIFYIGNGENYPALHTKQFDFPDQHLEKIAAVFYHIAADQE